MLVMLLGAALLDMYVDLMMPLMAQSDRRTLLNPLRKCIQRTLRLKCTLKQIKMLDVMNK